MGCWNFPRLPLITEHWDRTKQRRDKLQEEISHLTPTEPGKSDYKSSEPAVNNCFNFCHHIGDELRFHIALLAWVDYVACKLSSQFIAMTDRKQNKSYSKQWGFSFMITNKQTKQIILNTSILYVYKMMPSLNAPNS